eukprot:s1_g2067.t1
MVAIEKGIDWTLVPTDSSSAEHIARHPFGKTPAVEVNGHLLIESDAICRYLDEAFAGPGLIPEDPLERAEMTKWMSFVQAYMFPTTEFGLVMPRLVAPMMGRPVDESRVEKSLPTIAYQLGLVEAALDGSTFIASERLSLADIYLFCTWMAVAHTKEGKVMLYHSPNVSRSLVSKPLSIGLALLFVGLQIASLYHGATYGFAAHSHASKTIVAFDTPVFDVYGYDVPDDQNERAPDRFCDLDFYCDKLDKFAGAAQTGIKGLHVDVRLFSGSTSLFLGAEWQNGAARGPPTLLLS